MFDHLNDDIRECHLLANRCRQKASIEQDSVLRREYLEFERRWQTLARGYELADRLDQLGNSGLPACLSKDAA